MFRHVHLIAALLIALAWHPATAQQDTASPQRITQLGADSSKGEGQSPGSSPAPARDEAIQETKVETRIKTKRSETKEIDRNQQSGTGYGVYGGADLGVLFTTPSTELYKKLEASQIGGALAAKFGGTVFTRRIVLDLGLGIQYAIYSGERIGIVFDNLDIFPLKEKYSRKQLALLIDAAARIKFKQKFQFGIFGTALYNSKSVGFPALSLEEDPFPENYLVFIGPQFIYETPFRKNISRVGASFSIALTGAHRTSYLGTVHASLGSYLNAASTIIKTQRETRIRTKTVKEIISLKAETADVSDNISFVFDSQMINFKLNSAELSQRSSQFLADLAHIFMNERDLWEKLVIEGHTDSRGSATYNQKLSLLRAKSVAAELQKAGIPGSDLTTLGLGSQRPIVKVEQSDIDYARNRRVEIKVNGLKDARKLKKAIDEVQRKFFGGGTAVPAPSEPKPDSTPKPEVTPDPEPVFDPGIVPSDPE